MLLWVRSFLLLFVYLPQTATSTMSQLDQKILDAYRETRRQPKIAAHLRTLKKKMEELSEQIEAMQNELDQMEAHLHGLASAPLIKVREWLWKNTDDEYNEEKIAYYDRFMEYKALLKERELCQFESSVLESKLMNLEDVELQLEQLIAQKEKAVLQEQGPTSDELRNLHEEILFKTILIEEIKEADYYGSRALEAISGLLGNLNVVKPNKGDARYYSQTHLLFYLENAQSEIDEAYRSLHRFVMELRDISSEEPVEDYDDLIVAENFIGNLYKALVRYPEEGFVLRTIHRLERIKDRLLKSRTQLQKELGFTERSIQRTARKIELLLIRDSRLDLREEE